MSRGQEVFLGIACAAAVATLFSASPIRAQTAQGEPIKIGAVVSLTGPGAGLGQPERNGMLLAEKDVPDRTADQRELVAVTLEQAADLGHGRHPLAQQHGDRFLLFVAHGHGHRE